MPQFQSTFGAWAGALLAVLLFLTGLVILAAWVISHLPNKENS
jgi:hypothetical protein